MKRAWILVLALSLGVNAGLLYDSLSQRGRYRAVPDDRAAPGDQAGSGNQRAGVERGRGGDRQDPPGPAEDSGEMIRSHLDRMSQDLDLDARQRREIGAVHERLLPVIFAERRRMKGLRQDVTAAYSRDSIEPDSFRGLVRETSAAQARIDSLVTEAMLGEAEVLTLAQRQKYVRLAPWGHPLAPPERKAERPGDFGDRRRPDGEHRDNERTRRPARGERPPAGG